MALREPREQLSDRGKVDAAADEQAGEGVPVDRDESGTRPRLSVVSEEDEGAGSTERRSPGRP